MKKTTGVVTLIFLAGCSAGIDTTKDKKWSDNDVEYQLASIDANEILELDDPSIQKYSDILDELEKTCTNDRNDLGDLAVTAVNYLDDNKAVNNDDNYSVLKAVHDVVIEYDQEVECQETFALLMSMTAD